MANSSGVQFLTSANINPCLKNIYYSLRGRLPLRCQEIDKELSQGVKKPFKRLFRAYFGDCQGAGQPPITFLRQVLACATYAPLMEDANIPQDVKDRVNLLLKECKGQTVGSYTDSPGIDIIRKHVVEYIEKRDGCSSNMKNIVMFNGAGQAIRSVLNLFSSHDLNSKYGVLSPVPQYPIYSALYSELNIHKIDYYLNESKGWGLSVQELKRAITGGRKHCIPRAIVVINPGNPTGQVLQKENIKEIIKFAFDEKLLILADEVYQKNIYDNNSEFHSVKKVMFEMGPPYSDMELASFMSCSKGFFGECGLRGGYVELQNFDTEVQDSFMKSVTTLQCPNVIGQFALDCIVKPPEPGEPSYPLYEKEQKEIMKTLSECAKKTTDTFNSLEATSCNSVQGALYAFPKVQLPPKAIEAAKNMGMQPDEYYCSELLEKAGVCFVPGSGFGQEPGTWHFRLSLIPNKELNDAMMSKYMEFHTEFIKRHK